MTGFRALMVALTALVLGGCGSGGVQSPDFTPELRELAIDTPSGMTVAAGRSLTLTTTGTFTAPPGASPSTFTRAVEASYAVDNASIARIDGANLVGLRVGTVMVTASKEGVTSPAILVNVSPAVLDQIVVTPGTASIALGRTQDFSAMGIYSDSATPRAIDESVTWSSEDTTVATVPATPGSTVTASSVVPNPNVPESVQIRASATNSEGTVITGAGTLTVTGAVFSSLTTISPVDPTVRLGMTQQFMVMGTRSDGTSGAIPSAQLVWASDNTNVATIDAAGLATSRMQGTSEISATLAADTTQSVSTTLTVTPPVLTSIVITPPNPTISTLQTQPLTAMGIYTDMPNGPARPITGMINCPTQGVTGPAVVNWTSDDTGTVTVEPTGPTSDATGLVPGSATVTASSVNEDCATISGTTLVTVQQGQLESIVRVTPPSDFVIVGASKEFMAVGRFNDGREVTLDDDLVDWTADTATVASVDVEGIATGLMQGQTLIRATLKNGVGSPTGQRTATATLAVTDNVCTAPLLALNGATTAVANTGLCLAPLCSVSAPDNVIDGAIGTAATVNAALGLLGGTVSLSAISPTPIAGGLPAGFIIARPAGALLSAEVASQITIDTLRNGAVVNTTTPVTSPLRLTLLGTIGGEDFALATVNTTGAFDTLRLTFNAGVATALTTVNVTDSCAAINLPVTP